MTLVVTDEPPDRPDWIGETVRLLASDMAGWRTRLLARVERATEAELATGSPEDWGVGQIAVHLLLIERGVALIALALARGESGGTTGQPRPDASTVTRSGIHRLATKAQQAVDGLLTGFPAAPDLRATARHPYYGDLNAFGWLLTLNNHYHAHLEALDRGTASAL